jgi:hypothetical protein
MLTDKKFKELVFHYFVHEEFDIDEDVVESELITLEVEARVIEVVNHMLQVEEMHVLALVELGKLEEDKENS